MVSRETREKEQVGRVTEKLLKTIFVSPFLPGDATPDVLEMERFKCSDAVVTITNFLHGAEGQSIKILGHSNTTVANNANIQTNTGANKVLVTGLVYTFTLFDARWREDE